MWIQIVPPQSGDPPDLRHEKCPEKHPGHQPIHRSFADSYSRKTKDWYKQSYNQSS
jgi:hypothetical protein